MLNGELLYTYILEVNLFAFAYRLFMKISLQSTGEGKGGGGGGRVLVWREIFMKQSVGKCK